METSGPGAVWQSVPGGGTPGMVVTPNPWLGCIDVVRSGRKTDFSFLYAKKSQPEQFAPRLGLLPGVGPADAPASYLAGLSELRWSARVGDNGSTLRTRHDMTEGKQTATRELIKRARVQQERARVLRDQTRILIDLCQATAVARQVPPGRPITDLLSPPQS